MHFVQVGFAILKNVYGSGLILRSVPSFVRNPVCFSCAIRVILVFFPIEREATDPAMDMEL